VIVQFCQTDFFEFTKKQMPFELIIQRASEPNFAMCKQCKFIYIC